MELDSSDDDTTNRDKLIDNEMRSFRNRGFHDGYDEGKKAVLQEAFDTGYKKAFEQNFILSMLKGVACALKSSYNNNNNNNNQQQQQQTITTPTSTSSPSLSPSSANHLSILESMKFDETSDIESIKNDLIKICRENRLEILAHYVSQIR